MQEMIEREDDYSPIPICDKTALWQACFDYYVTREKDLLQPIHYAGYICDPDFLSHKQLAMPQCMIVFNELCENIFPDDPVRQTNAVMWGSLPSSTATVCTGAKLRNLQRVNCLGTGGRKCSLPSLHCAVFRPCIVHLPIPH
jgi:hypothetical protein